ncbi:glutamyl-tRNA amidotransferase [Lophiotrema nucula]|uniref:Glutamyl-tRNA amidotransferase n=1 Tax=Lophiotrema nucula TaxID=690887 RepID=A0A6A5YU36_9PLEO|nr:glutamyl-tRNA amidotransferase [Lophiotrema nucula]
MGARRMIRAAAVALAFGIGSVQSAVQSTGFTVTLTDVNYFLPPQPVASIAVTEQLEAAFSDGPFVPFTVVKSAGEECSASDLSTAVSKYLEEDDVFQPGFLSAIYVKAIGNGTISASQMQFGNISSTVITDNTPGSADIQPGPFFLSATGQVYEAWRLYSDTNGAFTESVYGNKQSEFSVLPAGVLGQHIAFAVPSKLYFERTAEKPLAGVRIGIKDIYDIKGLRTSDGNRAHYWLYGPANATATPVQRLIDAGAQIVGKMITSQFANGEAATADWVDYHEAFNPRGDGYQDTSSSSSGGGAGTAAYAWLDISLGSDTGGSVRNPAQVQGVYGNRPSHGLVGLEHTMPLSPVLDTPGLLARDPNIWAEVAKVMYGPNITFSNNYPSAITTIEWPTTNDTIADGLLLDFLAKVTDFLQANVSTFNITTAWAEGNPTLPPVEEYLNITYPILISQQQYSLFTKQFYADYAAKHDGRRPFIDPVPLYRWAWGQNSTSTVEEAVHNKTDFMAWFNSTVLVPDEVTCSNSLLMYVGTAATTQYRNVYLDSPVAPSGFGIWSVSGFSEVPDMVVPIGEAPYNSTITLHEEYLPVAVDFMAAKGCDGMIFSLIQDLHKAGILKTAKAGYSGVTGGDILFRRDLGM